MSERHMTVVSPDGLQSSSAALFVQLASHATGMVTIAREDDEPVSAKSFLSVESLDVRRGERIVLHSDDERTLEKLAELVSTGLSHVKRPRYFRHLDFRGRGHRS